MRNLGKSIQWYHNIAWAIDQRLIGNPDSRKLFQFILIESEQSKEFRDKLSSWFKNSSTLFLRDELCEQFKNKFKTELEWFNAFCGIDSIRMEVA